MCAIYIFKSDVYLSNYFSVICKLLLISFLNLIRRMPFLQIQMAIDVQEPAKISLSFALTYWHMKIMNQEKRR